MPFNQTGPDAQANIEVYNDQTTIHNYNHPQAGSPDIHSLLNPLYTAAYNGSGGGQVDTCLLGTRKDILAEVEGWIDGDDRRLICWLNGPAGFGKSTIAKTIAQSYAAKERLAASFRFFRGSGDQSKITRFIPTLACMTLPATRQSLETLFQREPGVLDQTLGDQFKKLLIEPVRAVEHFPAMVIVVDGIDECDDRDSMGKFLNILVQIAEGPRGLPFRIILTSRAEDHIQKQFSTQAARNVTYSLSLQNYNADNDIRNFLHLRLSAVYEQNRELRMRDVSPPWPSDSDLHALVEKSTGSFIFASTVANMIGDGTDLPQRKLREALVASTGLDNMYTRVISDAKAAYSGSHFERVLAAIILFTDALPVTNLACLLRLNPADILQALIGVQSVLIIPADNTQPVHPIHTSLREFLMAEERSKGFSMNTASRHLVIVMDCLRIMTKTEGSIFMEGPEQRYAALNWCYHLRCAMYGKGWGNIRDSELLTLMSCLTGFLSLNFALWVNTLFLYNEDGDMVDHLEALVLQLKDTRQLSQLLKMIKKIKKYVKLDASRYHFYLNQLWDLLLRRGLRLRDGGLDISELDL